MTAPRTTRWKKPDDKRQYNIIIAGNTEVYLYAPNCREKLIQIHNSEVAKLNKRIKELEGKLNTEASV